MSTGHSPLNVAVVGCGGIAQMMHLPTIAERPDLFRLAAVADVSAKTLEAVARRWSAPHATTEARSLFDRPDVDAVLLLSSGSHKELTVAALERGKHVFVEKPLAYDRAELREISSALEKSRAKLMVGYHKRFDPAVVRARELVERLEGLRFVEVTVLHPDDGAYRSHHAILPGSPEKAAISEREGDAKSAERAESEPFSSFTRSLIGKDAPTDHKVGTLILLESLIHDTNLLRSFLGEPEEVLSAQIWRGGLAQTSVSRFSADVRAVMSWVSLPGVRSYEERLRFIGPHGRVTLVFPSPYLRHAPTPLIIERMQGEDLVVEHRTVSYEEAFRVELHAFADAIARDVEPPTSVRDAAGDLRWIELIARSY
jgi:predicted dehydrogenase